MNTSKIFSDTMSFKTLGIILAIMIIPMGLFHILTSTDYTTLLYSYLFMIGTVGALLLLKISFSFSENALQFNCFPFIKNRNIPYNTIKKIEIENASFWKYGGLGIRFTGNGTAYVMGNEKNLVLYLANNKQIVLSFKEIYEQNIIAELQKHGLSFTKTFH